MTIRVAQVMGKMNGAGVEAVVMNYYRHIDRDRVQFDLLVDSDSMFVPVEEVEALGGRVIEVPPYQRQPQNSRELERLFRQEGWQIVHSHMNSLSFFPLRVARCAGVPVRIAHSHSTWGKGELKRNALKAVLRTQANRYPTHMMACTRRAGEWLFGKDADFTVLYNAIDLDRFRYDEEVRRTVRSALGIPGRAFVVGSAGRLTPQKNQGFLVRAFAEAFGEGDDAYLLLIGEGPDADALRCQVSTLENRNRILFLGQRDDMPSLYSAMDAFCLPSTYEGLGLVAVEAQASGLPTLLSDQVPVDAVVSAGAQSLQLKNQRWAFELRSLYAAGAQRVLPVSGTLERYNINVQAPRLVSWYESALAAVEAAS